MNDKLQRFIEHLVPFLILGVAIALVIGLFIMLSYVLVWGLLIGGVLWLISFIKDKFTKPEDKKHKGRIIDQK